MSDINRDAEEPIYSADGRGETFAEIVERRMSRRMFLKGIAASTVVVGAGLAHTAPTASAQEGKLALSFKPIQRRRQRAVAAGRVWPGPADRSERV